MRIPKIIRQRRFRNPESIPYISRMDFDRSDGGRGSTNGWAARITRDYKTHAKFFADGAWGGKAKALIVATKWRNKRLSELGPPRRGGTRGQDPYALPSAGTINRKPMIYQARDGNYYEYEAWVAWIRISPTEVRSTKWSIDKWGCQSC